MRIYEWIDKELDELPESEADSRYPGEVAENWEEWLEEDMTDNSPGNIAEFALEDIAIMEYMSIQLRCAASMYQYLKDHTEYTPLAEEFKAGFKKIVVRQQWLGG